ncbi:MAG: FAD-dependent oxidoreductase [Chloroflexota bacterium]
MSERFRKLLEPLQINSILFRNRMVKTPQDMAYAEKDGRITQKNLDFYESIALGGIGAIILEHSFIDSGAGSRPFMISVADDSMLPGLTKLAEVIHRYGCPVIQQLNHLGPQHNPSYSGIQALAPSALDEEYSLKTIGSVLKLREMTVPEIEEITGKFAEAAERARNAGMDGVEIHADHIYLLNSFLSRVWNKRHDDYGCQTLENRARFAVNVVRAVRKRVGRSYLVGIKINGAEYGAKDGITVRESAQIARLLASAGVDYIAVAGDGYGLFSRVSMPEQIFYPEPPDAVLREFGKDGLSSGIIAPVAAAVKKAVTVPVITVGGLSPAMGERMLQRGMADAIAFGRRLFADPEMPRKISEGRPEDIRPCTLCSTCGDLYARYTPVVCQVNASLGQGREAKLMPTGERKQVVVAGGGPAGMEAARVAALRGHDVTLYEKEPRLGGLLPLASLLKDTEIFRLPAFQSYLERQLRKLGVKVVLGKEFTARVSEKLKPDALILATGGIPDTPEIPGIGLPNVLTSAQLHRRVKLPLRLLGPKSMASLTRRWLPIGRNVVIIGGLIHGCELAEFLVKRGRKVTIVEESTQPGLGIPEIPLRRSLLKWLAAKGVDIFTGVKYREITREGLTVTLPDGKEHALPADNVLVAIPPKPDTRLREELKGKVPQVFTVGDGREPGLIVDATADGFQAALKI